MTSMQTHAHVEELRHNIAHVLHAAIHTFCMEISADAHSAESLVALRVQPGARRRHPPPCPYIENDPSLLRLKNETGLTLPLSSTTVSLTVGPYEKGVRKDISGSEMLHEQRFNGIWMADVRQNQRITGTFAKITRFLLHDQPG